jgi:hypothetical protein
MAGNYGEEYENDINALSRIASRRRNSRNTERPAPYKFGMLAKVLVPKSADWTGEFGSTKVYGTRERHSRGTSRSIG